MIQFIFKGVLGILFFGSNPFDVSVLSWKPIVNFTVISLAFYFLYFVFVSMKFFFNKNTEMTVRNYKLMFANSIQSFLVLFLLPILVLVAFLTANEILQVIEFDTETNIAKWIHREFLRDIISNNSLEDIFSSTDTTSFFQSDNSNTLSPFSLYILNKNTTVREFTVLLFVFVISLTFLYVFFKIFISLFKNEAELFYLFIVSPIVAITFFSSTYNYVWVLRNRILKNLIFKIFFFILLTLFNYFLNNYSQFLTTNNLVSSTATTFNQAGKVFNRFIDITHSNFKNLIYSQENLSSESLVLKVCIPLALAFLLFQLRQIISNFFNSHSKSLIFLNFKNYLKKYSVNPSSSFLDNTIFDYSNKKFTIFSEKTSPYLSHSLPNFSESNIYKSFQKKKYESFRRDFKW